MIKTEKIVKLPVMESFYTIQGEGYHQGKAAYFIRLAGCDVGCHWCDVKESWQVADDQYAPVDDLVEDALNYPARLAVITGGEPLIYDCDPLTSRLREKGFRTHIETSGAYPLSGRWDWICLSPKKFKNPKEEAYQFADELKVVIYNKSDFNWALQESEKVGPSCRLYLQPEWSKAQDMMPLIVAFVKNHPQWRVTLQNHKFLNIP